MRWSSRTCRSGCWSSAAASSAWKWRRCIARSAARSPSSSSLDQLMPGADADLVKPLAERLKKQRRRRAPEDEGRRGRSARRTASRARSKATSVAAADAVRSRARRGRAARRTAARSAPTRPASRSTERGFIAVDTADAHQRAAHLRDRRRRRPADARAQGDARRQGRRGSRRRREERIRRARDSVGRLHRSGNRLGRRDRSRSEGARA